MATVFDMGKTLNTITNTVNQTISTANTVSKTVDNLVGSAGSLSGITSVQGAVNAIGNVVAGAKTIAGAIEGLTDPSKFASTIRSLGIPLGGEAAKAIGAASAFFGGPEAGSDWRVRLTVPPIFTGGRVLAPLVNAGYQLIFPYTPTITLSGSASYEEQSITHQNYQFIYYNSSKSEQIQIVAPFNVEDSEQALYWIAAVHFLRSATKMFTGNDPVAGNPPAILRLNGYGNYVFKNVPVVVKQFSFDLPQDVNYINAGGQSWVPVKSTLQITLQPIYSRDAARNFSLVDFVNGKYVSQGYL
jgi:hypothetical protein